MTCNRTSPVRLLWQYDAKLRLLQYLFKMKCIQKVFVLVACLKLAQSCQQTAWGGGEGKTSHSVLVIVPYEPVQAENMSLFISAFVTCWKSRLTAACLASQLTQLEQLVSWSSCLGSCMREVVFSVVVYCLWTERFAQSNIACIKVELTAPQKLLIFV